MRFEGTVAFITGAGHGIGRAASERLASEGAAVVAVDLRAADAEEVADGIRAASGRAVAAPADVRDRDGIRRALDAGLDAFGRITHLVNSAGLVTMDGLMDLTDVSWDLVLNVNLKGTFLVTQAVAPAIAAAGGGAVVNLSSVEANVVIATGPHCQPHYNASKGGVKMLTKALAHELGPDGIRVNCVAPSLVNTGFAGNDLGSPETMALIDARQVIKRVGTPADVAGAIAFLLSDDASFITGTELAVDGGWLMY